MTDRDPDSTQSGQDGRDGPPGMRAGAFGLSSGLYYAPGSYSKTAKSSPWRGGGAVWRRLQQPHSRRGRLLHRRGGGGAGSHHHCRGRRADRRRQPRQGARARPAMGCRWRIVERIEAARARGVQVYSRPVSVRGQRHRHHRRADPALGAGRRPRRAAAPHPRRRAQEDPRGGAHQHRAARRRRHAGHQPLSNRPLDRREDLAELAHKAGTSPEEHALDLLRRATQASSRSTCRSATSS